MAYRKDDSSQVKKRLQLQERREARYTRSTASSNESKSTVTGTKKSVYNNDRQRKEAELVHKLPKDFPMDRWDKMPTKAQLSTMRYSGLNEQDQWTLLNTSTPLGTLSVLNKIQGGLDAKLHSPQKAAALADTANRLATEHKALNSGTASDLPSLQKRLLRGELDRKLDALRTNVDRTTNPALKAAATFDRKPIRRAGSSIGNTLTSTPKPEATPKPDDKPTGLFGRLISWITGSSTREEKETKQEPVLFESIAPEATPRMTQPPTPTPTPTPTPVPTPSERDRRAQAAVNAASAYADNNVKYTKGGSSDQNGFDCSGLVRKVCENTNLVFGQGNLSNSARYMVKSFFDNPEYGTDVYDYANNIDMPSLMPGDLVFSANPDNLGLDRHVSIATGNGLQVVEASDRAGINKVTYQFDAYDTINNDGLYVRGTGQVITYVIRPNY